MMKLKNLTCYEQKEKLNKHRTVLLLTAYEEVICTISWTKAVSLFFSGKAKKPHGFEEYHDIQTTSGIFKLPTVLVLEKFVFIPYRKYPVTRKNIMIRDNHQCQYCVNTFNIKNLTIHHLLPKSRGGTNKWTNLVAACYPCNSKKSNRTPEEAKMQLLKQPIEPTKQMLHITGINKDITENWNKWIN
jgi:5-methylcytosine-specific restriction endonuclease McrA